jgi:thioredoxin 1
LRKFNDLKIERGGWGRLGKNHIYTLLTRGIARKIVMAKPILMDFYADWCGPCKIQDPILEKLQEKLGDKIEFKKINVDDNLQLANKYGIRVVPTLILECNGKIIEHYIGVTRPEILEADLNKAAESCSE